LRFQRANEKPGKAIFTALNIKPFSDRVIVDISSCRENSASILFSSRKENHKKGIVPAKCARQSDEPMTVKLEHNVFQRKVGSELN
jgi:co-chaperonin GroES (HSP10)